MHAFCDKAVCMKRVLAMFLETNVVIYDVSKRDNYRCDCDNRQAKYYIRRPSAARR